MTYGTIAGMAAYVQHMTNASGTFDANTKPTLTEATAFLAQASNTLDGWLARAGYVIPVTASAAVAVLDGYANLGGAGFCELSMRNSGYSADDENRRENKFLKMFEDAKDYINSGALAALGAVTIGIPPPLAGFRVGGATRTGQPLKPTFTRTMFGNDPTAENRGKEAGYSD